jgi:hypothetical protein
MAATYDNGTAETGPRAEVHDNDRLAHRTQVELIEAAVAANDVESQLPKKELFKKYWPGVVFSMLLSLALVMEGKYLSILVLNCSMLILARRHGRRPRQQFFRTPGIPAQIRLA